MRETWLFCKLTFNKNLKGKTKSVKVINMIVCSMMYDTVPALGCHAHGPCTGQCRAYHLPSQRLWYHEKQRHE